MTVPKSNESQLQTFVSRGPVKLVRAFKEKGAKSYGNLFLSILEDVGMLFLSTDMKSSPN